MLSMRNGLSFRIIFGFSITISSSGTKGVYFKSSSSKFTKSYTEANAALLTS